MSVGVRVKADAHMWLSRRALSRAERVAERDDDGSACAENEDWPLSKPFERLAHDETDEKWE